MATNQELSPAANRGPQGGSNTRVHPTLFRVAALVVLLASSALSIGDTRSARADTCWALNLLADPPEGGTLQVIEGQQGGCTPGQYLDGTTYIVEAVANPGWRVAKMIGGDPVPETSNQVIGLFSADVTVQATFARDLTHAVPSPTDTIPQGAWRYYAIDVPEGVTSLEIAMTGTNDADLYTRLGALPTDGTHDCYNYVDGSSVETCTHLGPGAGTWYVGANGYGNSAAAITITATIDACWEIFASSIPAGFTPNISTAQDCPGGYKHGTTITVTPVASAESPFTGWYGAVTGDAYPLYHTVTGSAFVTALHALEVTEASPLLDQYVPTGASRYFYTDATATMNTVRFKAELSNGTGDVGLYGYPELDNGDKVCVGGATDQSPTGTCDITLPPPVRNWLVVSSGAESLVDISVSHCVQVRGINNPYEGGFFVVTGDPECIWGYSVSDEFYAYPTPSGGYVFAGWTPMNITGVPALVPLAGVDVDITAQFAKTLSSGVAESIPLDMPQGRFYHIPVPEHAASIQVAKSGPVTATLIEGNPFGGGCDSPCSAQFPAEGNWWVFVERAIDGPVASVTVTVTPGPACYDIETHPYPAAGGSFTFDPPSDPDCPAGKYKEGSQVTVEAVAAPGYTFLQGDPFGVEALETVTVDRFSYLEAYFGLPLTSGVPRSLPVLDSGPYIFYIDVPPGTASLEPNFSIPSELPFSVRFGILPFIGSECRLYYASTADSCAANNPAPGRWMLWFIPEQPSPAEDLTVMVTLGDELICRSVTVEASPPEAHAGLGVSHSPNCTPNSNSLRNTSYSFGFLQGTEVTFDFFANPGYVPVVVQEGQGLSSLQYFNPVTVTTDSALTVHYGTRVLPGITEDIMLPSSGVRAFYLDLPIGISQGTVQASGAMGVTLYTFGYSPNSSSSCFNSLHDDTKECNNITSSAISRWYIVLQGEQETPIDLTITLGTEFAGTIDTISPSVVYLGNSEPVQLSVHGFGFDPGDLVWFNGVALDTQFVSANLLTATIPVEMLGSSPQNYVVFVSPAEPLNLRDVVLPSNSVNLLFTRPSSDVNCDGESSSTDALDLLRYLAGFEVGGYCAGDVNLDGDVDIDDAVRLRAEIAGLLTRLPMPLAP